MSEIVNVALDKIEPNPFRLLKRYPFNSDKLASLQRSIETMGGLWEGVHARRKAGGYEIAFGHHRIEAAKRAGLNRVPLIVNAYDDESMLKMMGRENGEDYSTEFPILLETWEAAAKFLVAAATKNNQDLDIARLLGWTGARSGTRQAEQKLSELARACSAAHALIAAGHLTREDLSGMSVRAAREIVERAHSRMEMLDRAASKQRITHHETERAKKHIASGAKKTAQQVREGKIPQRDLRSQVDINSYRFAKDAKRVSPLFSVFAKALIESIARTLESDSASEKLEQVVQSLDKIVLDEDRDAVKLIDFHLAGLADRSERWRKRLVPSGKKVVPFNLLLGSK